MKGKKDYTMDELKQRVPARYHSEIEVFIKQDADKLRLHGPEDHEIRLVEGATPPFARNYKPMSAQELDAVKKYLDEQLAKGLAPRLRHLQFCWFVSPVGVFASVLTTRT
jgi:hypothetical protein